MTAAIVAMSLACAAVLVFAAVIAIGTRAYMGAVDCNSHNPHPTKKG